jgi:hypothetical protein
MFVPIDLEYIDSDVPTGINQLAVEDSRCVPPWILSVAQAQLAAIEYLQALYPRVLESVDLPLLTEYYWLNHGS